MFPASYLVFPCVEVCCSGSLILCTSSWLQEHGAGCSSIEVRAQPGTLSTVRSPRPRLPSMQWISSFPERRARVLSFPGAAYAQLHHSHRFPHLPAAQLDALCIVFPAGLGACWSGSPSLCARVVQSRAWHAARIIRAQQSGVRCRSDIWTSPAASRGPSPIVFGFGFAWSSGSGLVFRGPPVLEQLTPDSAATFDLGACQSMFRDPFPVLLSTEGTEGGALVRALHACIHSHFRSPTCCVPCRRS